MIKNLFKKNKFIIGMIHFGPLPGYENHMGMDKVLQDALIDLKNLEEGGVDAIMVENNYDLPHYEKVPPATVAAMTYLTSKIRTTTKLPIGISVLWNDYEAALSIAKICGGDFIRVPVFVDKVKTDYGIFSAKAKSVISFRKHIQADNVQILTDIHVKHSEILSKYTIKESARLAIKNGSDGIILTGKWTGHSPNVDELKAVRDEVKDFPIIIGSGASYKNAKQLAKYSDGVIVSTSIKTGNASKKQINIKDFDKRIDEAKTKKFVASFR